MALIHHWLMNETSGTTITDSVGGNTGTIAAGSIASEAAPSGTNLASAVTLSDNRFNLASDIDLTGDCTISVWADDRTTSGQLSGLFGDSASATTRVEFPNDANTTLRFRIVSTSLMDVSVNTTGFKLYTIVCSGTDVLLYVDGAVEDADIFGATDKSGTKTINRIGGSNAAIHNMIGAMADFRIYDNALSAGEISTLYNSYFPAAALAAHHYRQRRCA